MVVEQVHKLDYFCTGSVVRSVCNDSIFILAQTEMLKYFLRREAECSFF